MTYELRSVSPARLSRIMAVVLALFFLVFAIVAFPMLLFAPYPEDVEGEPPKSFFLVMVILYPLFGLVWGWVCGQVGARIYNWAAKRIGGVTFELEKREGLASDRAAVT